MYHRRMTAIAGASRFAAGFPIWSAATCCRFGDDAQHRENQLGSRRRERFERGLERCGGITPGARMRERPYGVRPLVAALEQRGASGKAMGSRGRDGWTTRSFCAAAYRRRPATALLECGHLLPLWTTRGSGKAIGFRAKPEHIEHNALGGSGSFQSGDKSPHSKFGVRPLVAALDGRVARGTRLGGGRPRPTSRPICGRHEAGVAWPSGNPKLQQPAGKDSTMRRTASFTCGVCVAAVLQVLWIAWNLSAAEPVARRTLPRRSRYAGLHLARRAHDRRWPEDRQRRRWTAGRRPQVLELFRRHVYGRVPATPTRRASGWSARIAARWTAPRRSSRLTSP